MNMYKELTFDEEQVLNEIADRAHDLRFACEQFQQFDPNVMMLEVHELAEMLCKVKSGHFKKEVNCDLFEQDDYYTAEMGKFE